MLPSEPEPVPEPDPEPEGEPLPALHDELALGATHSCLLERSGRVQCWGSDRFGQLGDPDAAVAHDAHRATAAEVRGLSGVIDLAVGTFHSCALLDTGRARCWGHGGFHQLGNANTDDSRQPVELTGLGRAVELALGEGHSCARLASRRVACWGRNTFGQLGDGTTTDRATPAEIADLEGVLQLVAGRDHVCARVDGGEVRCWGGALDGQMGDGHRGEPEGYRTRPVVVPGVSDAMDLVAGSAHTCAILAAGTVRCWGRGDGGQLGNGPGGWASLRAVTVPRLRDAVQLAAGAAHTCARTAAGQLPCWGFNNLGQLGDGTQTVHHAPVPVPRVADAVDVAAGARHTCARRSSGEVWCWGANGAGQLGDGTTEDRLSPVRVRGLSAPPAGGVQP